MSSIHITSADYINNLSFDYIETWSLRHDVESPDYFIWEDMKRMYEKSHKGKK